MKAQERFNVRSAAWIELQRPNIACGHREGVVVAFEGRDAESNNPRVLHVVMAPMEALDLAERLVRAVRMRQVSEGAAVGDNALTETGHMLLQSQQTFLSSLLAAGGDGITQRMMQAELDRINRELAAGHYLPEQN